MSSLKTQLHAELTELERQATDYQDLVLGQRFSSEEHKRLQEIQDRIELLRQLLDNETH